MTKEEMNHNLKNFKKNISSLEIKKRKKDKLSNELIKLRLEHTETPISLAPGINNDIRSKNKVSNKVENAVVNKISKIEELEDEIYYLKLKILELEDNTEDVRIRLKSLNFKESKFIEEYYFNGRTYEEIGNIVYFDLFKQTRSGKTIKKEIENIVEKLAEI